jgi:anti-sigma B factor antagonist
MKLETLSERPLAVWYPAAAFTVKFFLSPEKRAAGCGAEWLAALSQASAVRSCALGRGAFREEPGLNSLEIGVLKHGEVTAVTLRGALVLGPPVDGLRQTLENLTTHGEFRIVLGLAEITKLDSSGIGLLVKALQWCKEAGGSVKLVNPARVVVQTLSMCRLLPLFEVYDDEAEAVASFG